MSDDNLRETIFRLIKAGEALRIELERELASAYERIKRLEEAGDAMAQELVRRGLRKEIDGWIAAKEVKP